MSRINLFRQFFLMVLLLVLLLSLTACQDHAGLESQEATVGTQANNSQAETTLATTSDSGVQVEWQTNDLKNDSQLDTPVVAVPGSANSEVNQTLQAIDQEMDAMFESMEQAENEDIEINGEGWGQ